MIRISLAPPFSAKLVANTIAQAFVNLPASRWLVPDVMTRGVVLATYFYEPAEYAVQSGTAYINELGTAAAIWLPQGAAGYAIDKPDHEKHVKETVGEFRFGRFMRFEEAQEKAHPKDLGEHWYLPLIGVLPYAQRKGYGTALLNAVHPRLDELDIPAYLEAASGELTRYYARFGYEPCGDPIVLDGEPLLWPMVREPRKDRGVTELVSSTT